MAGILGGDYQFDPGTYGYGSGLLGLLGMGQQLPAQVPGGFAPADNSVLPQQSAPTGGMLPPQMAPQMAPQAAPQQPIAQAPGLGLGDRAMAALANFSNARGLLPALTGAVTGGLTGQRTDPVGMMLQQQSAIYGALKPALMAKGASEAQADALARAGAFDPEIRKQIASTIYQTPQLVDLGTNPLTGTHTKGIYNPNNPNPNQSLSALTPVGQSSNAFGSSLTPQNAAALGLPPMNNNQLEQIQALTNSGIMGDEFTARLKDISPAFAAKIQGMANADLPYPSGFVMKTPYGGMITDAISAMKPGVTAQDYSNKQAAQKAWTSGPDASAVKSVNQAITHADKAWSLIDKLPNLNVGGPIGSAINTPYLAARALGDKQYQSDKEEYSKLIQALSGELMTASRGSGHGSVEEIRQWRDGALGASSPAEMRGSIRGAMDFLDGATNALAAKKTAAFKSLNAVKADDLFEPGQKQKFDKIHESSESGPLQVGPSQAQSAPRITTQADYAKLPKGSQYLAPDGTMRTKQ